MAHVLSTLSTRDAIRTRSLSTKDFICAYNGILATLRCAKIAFCCVGVNEGMSNKRTAGRYT